MEERNKAHENTKVKIQQKSENCLQEKTKLPGIEIIIASQNLHLPEIWDSETQLLSAILLEIDICSYTVIQQDHLSHDVKKVKVKLLSL